MDPLKLDYIEICRQKFPNDFQEWAFPSNEEIFKRMSPEFGQNDVGSGEIMAGSDEIVVSRELNMSDWMTDILNNSTSNIVAQGQPQNILYWTCFVFGVPMNVLVLLVLLAGDPGDKRSPTSLYLTHMAMADLLYLTTIPLAMATRRNKEFTASAVSCTYQVFTQSANFFVSVLMLTLLSIDRYVAIMSSTNRSAFLKFARKLRTSTNKMTALCLIVWITAVILVLPGMANVGKWSDAKGEEMNSCGIILVEPEDVNMNGQVCQQLTPDELAGSNLTEAECQDHVQLYLSDSTPRQSDDNKFNECLCRQPENIVTWRGFLFLIGYLLPLITIVFCYSNILIVLQKTNPKMLNKSGGKNYRSRATLLIAILVMSYFVALTPFHLFGYLQTMGGILDSRNCKRFGEAARVLTIVHSTLNPVIYSFLSYGYRNRLALLWKRFSKNIFCAQFHHIMSRSASNATRTTDRSYTKTKDDCTVPKESRENLLQPDLLPMTTPQIDTNSAATQKILLSNKS